jgi:hypothetical protein
MIPKQNVSISLKKPHSGDLIVSTIPFSNQYEITLYSSWVLSRKDPNNCVMLDSGEVVCISNFIQDKEDTFIVGQKFSSELNFYSTHSTFPKGGGDIGTVEIGPDEIEPYDIGPLKKKFKWSYFSVKVGLLLPFISKFHEEL